MAKYINAEDLRTALLQRSFYPAIVAYELEHMPAADVVEVKHGHWDKSIDNGVEMHQCSVCGARVVKGVYEYENPNKYCYHCGAKMEQILRIVGDGVKDVTSPELIKRYKHYFSNDYIDEDTEE